MVAWEFTASYIDFNIVGACLWPLVFKVENSLNEYINRLPWSAWTVVCDALYIACEGIFLKLLPKKVSKEGTVVYSIMATPFRTTSKAGLSLFCLLY